MQDLEHQEGPVAGNTTTARHMLSLGSSRLFRLEFPFRFGTLNRLCYVLTGACSITL